MFRRRIRCQVAEIRLVNRTGSPRMLLKKLRKKRSYGNAIRD
jgi:hypothetical protein